VVAAEQQPALVEAELRLELEDVRELPAESVAALDGGPATVRLEPRGGSVTGTPGGPRSSVARCTSRRSKASTA
jgi:hypothetical protein